MYACTLMLSGNTLRRLLMHRATTSILKTKLNLPPHRQIRLLECPQTDLLAQVWLIVSIVCFRLHRRASQRAVAFQGYVPTDPECGLLAMYICAEFVFSKPGVPKHLRPVLGDVFLQRRYG